MSGHHKLVLLVIGITFAFLFVTQVQPQTPVPKDCPEIVNTALEITERVCDNTGRNEVCYGHFNLEASPYADETDFQFDEPGDRENITALRSLRLSAMDELLGIWGVALMAVEATQEEGGAEDVTFVMFGDVAVNNPLALVGVTASRSMNVRLEPDAASAIIGTLNPGDILTANGRLADSSWIRVRFSEGVGWVFATSMTSDVNLERLTVIDPTEALEASPGEIAYGPMQVFTLETGSQDAPCDEAPNSGLMIQTPEGAAEVTLLLNEVDITLRATAYVQAQAGGDMQLFVVDGTAIVESDGVSHTLIPGTSLKVPLDQSGTASGPPTEPEPYDVDQLIALPIHLLQNPVEIPPPLVQPAGVPVDGEWAFRWNVDAMTCENGETVAFTADASTATITAAEDGSSLTLLLTRYNRVETGVYDAVFADALGNLHRHTLTVTSLDRISGEAEIEYIDIGCSLVVPFTLSLVQVS